MKVVFVSVELYNLEKLLCVEIFTVYEKLLYMKFEVRATVTVVFEVRMMIACHVDIILVRL